MGAPLCMGKVQSEVESDRPGDYDFKKRAVLKCPWHKWEFRMSDGSCITSPDTRVKVFETHVKNGEIFVKV
jgi:nitrite reductase/ring-hydroxylating ferredoxin subunit